MALGVLVLLSNRWVLRRHHNRRVALERLVQQRTRDLQQANRQLEAISLTDPLTSLHNRRYLARQLPADIAYYQRMPRPLPAWTCWPSCCWTSTTSKSINDGHGHQAGDHVLQTVAHRLRMLSREGDYVVRWGGEEFLMVFRPMPRHELHALGRRICTAIASEPVEVAGTRLQATASLGLIGYLPFPEALDLLGWGATGFAGGPRTVRGQGARAERLGGLRSLAVALAVARCQPCTTRSRRACPQWSPRAARPAPSCRRGTIAARLRAASPRLSRRHPCATERRPAPMPPRCPQTISAPSRSPARHPAARRQ